MHFKFAIEFFYIFLRKLSKTIKKHELYFFVWHIFKRVSAICLNNTPINKPCVLKHVSVVLNAAEHYHDAFLT